MQNCERRDSQAIQLGYNILDSVDINRVVPICSSTI